MNSSIAREADMVVYTHAGREIAVATTKAYLMQVYYLGLMAIKASDIKYTDMIKYYQELPILMEKLISYDYSTLAKKLYKKDNIFYLGRNVDYALSLEGSLKLKEISYIESVAYPSGELKHGTISLITDGIPVISIITKDDILDKSISNIKEVNARGAYSIIIAKEDFDIERDTYKDIIKIPSSHPILMPLLAVIPLQLISYEVAKLKGYDIDKPRNLAKSVTVE
jgi:glucosamine--fructose-6-phosphate aminotransferase (isomerizing)